MHGRDGLDGKDGAPGKDGLDGKDGAPGESGRDGLDGKDGAPGKSITMEDVAPLLETAVAKLALDLERREQEVLRRVEANAQELCRRTLEDIPKPRDGFGFDDMTVLYDGERKVTFRYQRGDVIKDFDFALPIPIYKGVFKPGDLYDRGDTVTYSGSLWAAERTTNKRPLEEDSGWRLAVKKGVNGKDLRS
jgi:integrin beta 3